jgi:hypothetical protein
MRRSRDLILLLVMWSVTTAFEVTKAVHVDDTAHLEIARAILADPTHPMSGLVNWADTAEPIHMTNQPHLLFYVMAGVMRAAPGHVEQAMHLVWIVFSGFAIALFYALARTLETPSPLLWTAMFCLGPAFIPSQNLMVDVPLVALWLAFFLVLTREDAGGGILAASVLAAAACLVKYSSLVLLPILVLVIVRRRQPRRLTLLLIPLGILVAWSVFNWFDYGGIHIFARPIATAAAPGLMRGLAVIVGRAALWLVALGAIAPFTPAFVRPLLSSCKGRWLLAATSVVAVTTSLIGRAMLPAEPVVQSVLRGLFFANGCLVAALTTRALRSAREERVPDSASPHSHLEIWVVATALFIVVFSPFIAVRHVLLALPAVLLLIARGRDAAQVSRRGWIVACGLTIVVGMAVGASDARLADLYRRAAPDLASRFCHGGTRCVAVGHWGWQWYASRAGLETYDRERSHLHPGDRVILSELAGKQVLPARDSARFNLVAQVEAPSTLPTLVRTIATEKSSAQGDRSGGFYYFWTSVPWTITTRPLDRFLVYEVGSR